MRLVAGKERSEVYAPKEPSTTAALHGSSPPREQFCESEVVFVDIRVARDVGPLSSQGKKVINCWRLTGRRWIVRGCEGRVCLCEGRVEIDGFTLKRESSQALDRVVIEVRNKSTSSARFLIRTRRLDVVKLAWFGTPQTVSNEVNRTLAAPRARS